MSDHWSTVSHYFSRLVPPLKPSEAVVEAYRGALSASNGRVLLYGVTPELAELADLGRQLIAVDNSSDMIDNVWPGNTGRRRAVLADWFALPLRGGSVTAALGDGAVNSITFPDGMAALLDDLARVLIPGGRAAFRVYCTPESLETLDQIHSAAFNGEIGNIHALKWRIAMACMTEWNEPNICVATILARFNDTFPDRAALAAHTGWSFDAISMIDGYAGSSTVYSFPTLSQVLEIVGSRFGEAQVLAIGDYPLAERCPLIVFRNGTGAA